MKRIAFVLGFGVFGLVSANAQTIPPKSQTSEKYTQFINYIQAMYVDSVKTNELTEVAIRAVLETLDPHSVYIPKEEVDEMNAPLKGNFDGIVIRFQIMKDTIMVVQTIPGGPSEKTGVRAGDKIIAIEGQAVAGVGIKNHQVRDKLLGEKGTKVSIEVVRRDEKKPLRFTITRDKIPIFSLDAAYMATPEIGYIKLNAFGQTTMAEFTRAFDSLKT